MKRIFGLLLLLISSIVFAAPAAYVHALDGEARASMNNASRALQIGSLLEQGDEVTVSKGVITMKFEDGQIVALQQGARFRIDNYSYNKAKVADSNVVLSLLSGGMRYITGVIGGTNRNAIRLQAGTATIGIRGTDIISFVDASGNVLATVQEGAISFGSAGVTATLNPGQGSTASPNQAPSSGTSVTNIPAATVRTVTPLGLIITPGNNPVKVAASAELVKAVAAVAKAADDLRKATTPKQIEDARKLVADAVAAATIKAREETIANQAAKQEAVLGGAPVTTGTQGATQGTGVGTTPAPTVDPAISLTVSVTGTTTAPAEETTLQTTIPATVTCTGGVSGC